MNNIISFPHLQDEISNNDLFSVKTKKSISICVSTKFLLKIEISYSKQNFDNSDVTTKSRDFQNESEKKFRNQYLLIR